MVVTINKDSNREEIDKALKKFQQSRKEKKLGDFFGKMKGSFGDGLDYQKKIRNEWD